MCKVGDKKTIEIDKSKIEVTLDEVTDQYVKGRSSDNKTGFLVKIETWKNF